MLLEQNSFICRGLAVPRRGCKGLRRDPGRQNGVSAWWSWNQREIVLEKIGVGSKWFWRICPLPPGPGGRYYRAIFKNQVLGTENLSLHSRKWSREEDKPQTKVLWQLKRKRMCVCSAVSNSLQPQGMEPARFLCRGDFLDENTWEGGHFPFRESYQSRDWPHISCIGSCFFPCLFFFLSLNHQGSPYLESRIKEITDVPKIK